MNALIEAIHSGDLQMPLPQALSLHNGETLRCEQLLRLMPGKRGVFKARYRNQCVLAKIFLASAARQADREHAGYERLLAARQPTPRLIDDIDGDGGNVLLYEFLSDALPLFRENAAPDAVSLQRVLDRLQSMYGAGVYHGDLHWGNFLWQGDTAYVIDAGAVLGDPSRPLSPAQMVDNLGIFIAQFHRCDQPLVYETVINHDVCSRFKLSAIDIKLAAETYWRQRREMLLQKCFRGSTAQCFEKTFDHALAYRRVYAGAGLKEFLSNPDATMSQGEALKLGNSATVAKLMLDGREVVIKRYNIKNIFHWLRRCWRPSRAWASWRNAHWLELLGLRTPAPIAFLEMRCGWLRRRAYYVCEYVEGEALSDALHRRDPNPGESAELEKYFSVAASEHLIHGDMKANNFLVHENRLFVLDLDAMSEASRGGWKKLYLRDFERFSRNWSEDSAKWLAALSQHVTSKLEDSEEN